MILGLLLLAVLVGYLMGSIPSGYLIARAVRGIDIRKHGSGNIGATNVARIIGLRWFLPVFVCDMLKALIPVGLIHYGFLWPFLTADVKYWPGLASLAGLAALLGNMFPIFLQFKGGKGASTGVGILLPLTPIATGITLLVFVLVLLVTRFVSLGSVIAAMALVVSHLVIYGGRAFGEELWPITTLCILGAALVIFRHQSNMVRLLKGTEPKAWGKKA